MAIRFESAFTCTYSQGHKVASCFNQRKHFLLLLMLLMLFFTQCKQKNPAPSLATTSLSQRSIILLQPLGDFPAPELEYLRPLVADFYKTDVIIGVAQSIPKNFITAVKGRRYRADSILRWLKKNQPTDIRYTAGLITTDISTTIRNEDGSIKAPASRYADWGVFGLGYQPGPSCVISSFRIKKGTMNQYRQRLAKVVLHELGHNMGLPHCINACFMKDAVEKLSTVDAEPMTLCEDCRKKLTM
jgi:archaemetzincin